MYTLKCWEMKLDRAEENDAKVVVKISAQLLQRSDILCHLKSCQLLCTTVCV